MPVIPVAVHDLEGVGPVLKVELGNSLTGRQRLLRQNQPVPGSMPVRALVDTGADMTVIHDGLAQQLQLTLVGFQMLASGLAGSPLPGASMAPEYSARVELAVGAGFDITVLEIPLPAGLQLLIGRDLLAKGLLFYEGINDQFTLAF